MVEYILLKVDDWAEAFKVDGDTITSLEQGHSESKCLEAIIAAFGVSFKRDYLEDELAEKVEDQGSIGEDICREWLNGKI